MKTVTFLDSAEFRRQVLKGLRELATITAQTLGPGGRPILLEQENGTVLATKDGVTVAKAFAANTPVERLVAKAAVEASERTVRSCGDGTTTSMLLAYSIVEAGQDYLQKNPTESPQALARALKEEIHSTVIPMIKDLAKPIRNLPMDQAKLAVWHVANVSANFDKEISDAVADAVELVGEDGMVQCEEGSGGETRIVHQTGFPVMNRGLKDLGGSASAAFVNRKNYGDCVLSGAYVALYDGDVNDVESIMPLIERVLAETDEQGTPLRHPLVIVAHYFSDQVLRFLATNFRQQRATVVPFLTQFNGQSLGRQGFLHDLAAYVGGQVFDPQGNLLYGAMPSNIGFATEVRIGESNSVFLVDGLDEESAQEHQQAIESRIHELKAQMEGASEFDCDRLRYRIGQLASGIATIYAGGATALEARERRDRVVDAVSAVRSAMDLGVVPGGGTTLLHVARSLSTHGPSVILRRALIRPFVQILSNAGVVTSEEQALQIAQNIGHQENDSFVVYDALKKEAVEFWESGIFDGAKTVTQALQNALSVAQLLMTTGGAIAHSTSEGEDQAKAFQKVIHNIQNGEIE